MSRRYYGTWIGLVVVLLLGGCTEFDGFEGPGECSQWVAGFQGGTVDVYIAGIDIGELPASEFVQSADDYAIVAGCSNEGAPDDSPGTTLGYDACGGTYSVRGSRGYVDEPGEWLSFRVEESSGFAGPGELTTGEVTFEWTTEDENYENPQRLTLTASECQLTIDDPPRSGSYDCPEAMVTGEGVELPQGPVSMDGDWAVEDVPYN